MKYSRLTTEQIKEGLRQTAEAMEAEVKFIRELSAGGFVLPKDSNSRNELLASHGRILEKLQKDFDELSKALVGG